MKEWSWSDFPKPEVLKTVDFEKVIVLPCNGPGLDSSCVRNSEYREWVEAGAGGEICWSSDDLDGADLGIGASSLMEVTKNVEEEVVLFWLQFKALGRLEAVLSDFLAFLDV